MAHKVKQMDWNGKGMKAWRFFCPGCQEHHAPTESWGFNGDLERPTFTPSILVKGSKMTAKGEEQYRKWRDAGCQQPAPNLDYINTVCHSFVTDGKIKFLNDCTHY